jgi:hypothetical protein
MRLIVLAITLSSILSTCTNKVENRSMKAPEEIMKESNAPLQKTKEVTLLKFDKNDIPKEIKYQGEIVDGARWTDGNGENILIITETKTKQLNDDVREEYLYGYTYVKMEGEFTPLWSINDHVTSYCDVGADYIPGSLEVLDIDHDGIAENAFIYKLEERCDVSPLDIKLMMHSDKEKLVIRGTTTVNPGDGKKYGGDKKFDIAFNSSPEIFKDYASRKWDKFMKEYQGL